MQHIDVEKLCQIKCAEASIEKLVAGPRIEYFSNDSKHPLLQTLKQMQFEASITDIHDANSVHFAAMEEMSVYGGARLVLHSAHLGLPCMPLLNEHIGINKSELSQYAEITHFVTKQEARRRHSDTADGASKSLRSIEGMKSHQLTKNQIFILRLLKAIFEYAKKHSITYLVFSMTESMQQTLRAIHFTFEIVEKAFHVSLHQGQTVCVFDIPVLERHLLKTGHRVGQWFVRAESEHSLTSRLHSSCNQVSHYLSR